MDSKHVLIVGLLLIASGCAPTGKLVRVASYKPFVAMTLTPTAVRWAALPAVLVSGGWRMVDFDEQRHRMMATLDHPEGIWRDQVTIWVEPARTRIALQTERIDENRGWDRAVVCASYAFWRERSLAALIEEVSVAQATPATAMARIAGGAGL